MSFQCIFPGILGAPSIKEWISSNTSRSPSHPNIPSIINCEKTQEFLGMINFYHYFLPDKAATFSPFYWKLKSSKPRKEQVWSQEMQQAFPNGKTALANAAMLVNPCTDNPLVLTLASDVAAGPVFEQFNKCHWQPLVFFSRQLRKAEIKCSAFNRELRGAHLAIRHFHFMLEGQNFTNYTDHKPLVHTWQKQQNCG